MNDFVIRELTTTNIETELVNIGFDKSYISTASDKYRYKTFKLYDLSIPQANIIKQTALSYGADCAVHRDVLVNNIDKTDAILGGSYSQLLRIVEKLKQQPFSLKELASYIEEKLRKTPNNETKIIGIVNLSPDSFSNDGFDNPNKAIEHIHKLIDDGADIIDIGAESTRPGSIEIPAQEQIKRLKSVLLNLQDLKVPISLDTRNSEVARFGLDNGVSIINDVSGLDFDKKMINIIANYNASIVIQHTKGTPDTMQENPYYNDVIDEIYLNLLNKINKAKENGIKNIIIDPGIGFGKNKKHNFEILNRINEFKTLNCPIMVGISRKSFLCPPEISNEGKDALSLALAYPLIQNKIDYLRVHNVKLHKQLLSQAI